MASWSRNQRSIVRSKRVSTSVGAKVTFWYLAADALGRSSRRRDRVVSGRDGVSRRGPARARGSLASSPDSPPGRPRGFPRARPPRRRRARAGDPASSAAASRSSASWAGIVSSWPPVTISTGRSSSRAIACTASALLTSWPVRTSVPRRTAQLPGSESGYPACSSRAWMTFAIVAWVDSRITASIRSSPSASLSAVTPPIETPKSAICSGAFVVSSQSTNASTSLASRTPCVVSSGLALPVVAEIDDQEVVLVVEDRGLVEHGALVAAPAMGEDHGRTGRTGFGSRRDVPARQPGSVRGREVFTGGGALRRAVRRVFLCLQGRVGLDRVVDGLVRPAEDGRGAAVARGVGVVGQLARALVSDVGQIGDEDDEQGREAEADPLADAGPALSPRIRWQLERHPRGV